MTNLNILTIYCGCVILLLVLRGNVGQPFLLNGGNEMKQSDVVRVRKAVNHHIGSKVRIRSNKGRHKVDITEGIITETYPSIFLIEVKNEIEDTLQTVSFSYTDVLTNDVQMMLV